VAFAELPELPGELDLGVADLADGEPDPHGSITSSTSALAPPRVV
jgi:hypothetical protein